MDLFIAFKPHLLLGALLKFHIVVLLMLVVNYKWLVFV